MSDNCHIFMENGDTPGARPATFFIAAYPIDNGDVFELLQSCL